LWLPYLFLATDRFTLLKGSAILCTAIRLRNGFYRFGKRVLSYARVQQLAKRRKHKWIHIIEDVSGTHVDTIEVAD
jgi:hypothetical protein